MKLGALKPLTIERSSAASTDDAKAFGKMTPALAELVREHPKKRITVIVTLPRISFGPSVAPLDKDERRARIDALKRGTQTEMAVLAPVLRATGAKVLASSWLTQSAEIEITASKVPQLVAAPGIVSAELPTYLIRE